MKKLLLIAILPLFFVFVFAQEDINVTIGDNDTIDCNEPKIYCNDICVLAHCYRDNDCDDFNPYTTDKCINEGSCEARCEFNTGYNESVSENVVNSSVNNDNMAIVQNVRYYRNESNNKTYISGSFSVDKEITKDYLLFIMNDPHGFIINRIDKAHFSIQPWRVTDTQIIWKLKSNETTLLIRYWFDEELSEEIVKEDIKIEETTKVREPNLSEKVYGKVSNKSDIFVSDKLNRIVMTLFVVIMIVVGGFVFYLVRQKKERVQLIKEIK